MPQYKILIKHKKAEHANIIFKGRNVTVEGKKYFCFEQQIWLIKDVPAWVAILGYDKLPAALAIHLSNIGYDTDKDCIFALLTLEQ